MITVRWVNNHGGGWVENVQVKEGTTSEELLSVQLPGIDVSGYNILINHEHVASNQVLNNNDLFVVVPVKIDGAR